MVYSWSISPRPFPQASCNALDRSLSTPESNTTREIIITSTNLSIYAEQTKDLIKDSNWRWEERCCTSSTVRQGLCVRPADSMSQALVLSSCVVQDGIRFRDLRWGISLPLSWLPLYNIPPLITGDKHTGCTSFLLFVLNHYTYFRLNVNIFSIHWITMTYSGFLKACGLWWMPSAVLSLFLNPISTCLSERKHHYT